MNAHELTQLILYLATLLVLVRPLGTAMAFLLSDQPDRTSRWWKAPERWIYRISGVRPETEMSWIEYLTAALLFNGVGLILVWVVLVSQGVLPGNPEQLPGVPVDLAWNTAISFVTNTNWQAYGGESTMSYFSQMVALTSQNFLSAATGLAVLMALVRGFTRHTSLVIGNFWVDLARGTLYVLLPLATLWTVLLVSQGVVQTWKPYERVSLIEAVTDSEGHRVTEQTIAVGPVASQVAIKQLGTNGGGYFNVNSAHPLENPTPLSNFLQVLAILLIPAALCYTFGEMIHDRRQGWALLCTMTLPFAVLLMTCCWLELQAPALGSQHTTAAGAVETTNSTGGNLEGKEVRFGVVNSALWAVATTAASNGSVNSMHDSYTPLGGMIPLWLMQLGEVLFGGVGSGLYGLLLFALIAVFVAGLMVGRTPEYLGKKIDAFEIKMAMVGILLPCAMVLLGTAVAVMTDAGRAGVLNQGPHGFTEILYACSSAANNNGSAFAGLSANTPFYNTLLGMAMLIGRYGVLIPVIAIAGSLASKKNIPVSAGTLPTHTPLFVGLLISTIVLVGALTFIPALALGPIADYLQSSM